MLVRIVGDINWSDMSADVGDGTSKAATASAPPSQQVEFDCIAVCAQIMYLSRINYLPSFCVIKAKLKPPKIKDEV